MSIPMEMCSFYCMNLLHSVQNGWSPLMLVRVLLPLILPIPQLIPYDWLNFLCCSALSLCTYRTYLSLSVKYVSQQSWNTRKTCNPPGISCRKHEKPGNHIMIWNLYISAKTYVELNYCGCLWT